MTEIKTNKKNNVHLIAVHGEIDAESSIHLDNALKEAIENEEKQIAVNLSELSYISSAGLGVFISHLDEFEIENIHLVLFGINESVKEVFAILGLEKLLKITETEEEAIQSFYEQ
ncbi:MAG: STAS domain-containing protein [Bacteroidota bacterium]